MKTRSMPDNISAYVKCTYCPNIWKHISQLYYVISQSAYVCEMSSNINHSVFFKI